MSLTVLSAGTSPYSAEASYSEACWQLARRCCRPRDPVPLNGGMSLPFFSGGRVVTEANEAPCPRKDWLLYDVERPETFCRGGERQDRWGLIRGVVRPPPKRSALPEALIVRQGALRRMGEIRRLLRRRRHRRGALYPSAVEGAQYGQSLTRDRFTQVAGLLASLLVTR